MEQRSDEWFRVRAGKVTASRVADIVANGRGNKESARRRNYRAELMTERLTGIALESFTTGPMQWGVETEQAAKEAYQRHNLVRVDDVAFVPHPTIGMAGASPDGLVGNAGLLETKCPNSKTQIVSMADHYDLLNGKPLDADYGDQAQWQMACTGRQWCDLVSFDPRLPEAMQLFALRVPRDDERIAELEGAVIEFLAEVEANVSDLRAQYEKQPATVLDAG